MSGVAVTKEHAQAQLLRAQTDPCWWIKSALGNEIHHIQCEVVESVRDHRETVVGSCHGMGKSWIAARAAIWFLFTHKPAVVITTAPGDRQVRRIIWKEIAQAHRDARVPLGGRLLTQELSLDADHFAIGFTAPDYDPDRFKGFHEENILVIADEAAGVSDAIYTAIDGTMTGRNPRLLLIGNPTADEGRFAGSIEEGGYGVNVIQVSAFDTPNLALPGITLEDIKSGAWEEKHEEYLKDQPREYHGLVDAAWVRGAYERWGEESPKWSALVLGQIPTQSDVVIYERKYLEQAKALIPNPEDVARGSIDVGIDPAGPGKDETAICGQSNGSIVIQEATAQAKPEGWVLHHLNPYKSRIRIVRVDAAGEGRSTARILENNDYPVYEVAFGEKAQGANDTERQKAQAEFQNLKAQIHWQLRDRLKAGTVRGLTDETTLRQLRSLRWGINKGSGRIEIESKETREKRGLVSPDRGEATMLAFARIERGGVPDLEPSYW